MRIIWLVLYRQTITYKEIRLALHVLWAMKFWKFLLVHYPKVIPKECLSLGLVHLPFRTGTLHCRLICTARSCLGCTNIKNYCHNHMRALQHACARNNGKQHPAFTRNVEKQTIEMIWAPSHQRNQREKNDMIITKAIITLHWIKESVIFFFLSSGTFPVFK